MVNWGCKGRFVEAGWDAAHDCPGIVFSEITEEVTVHIFESGDLPHHWDRVDIFEGDGYRRAEVLVETDDGVLPVSICEVIV